MSVAANLAAVRERIADACRRTGRSPLEVRVVAVTKTHPAAAAAEAVAAGVEAIGENRVQEAATKRPLLTSGVPWHLVGPLQRNKAAKALEVFDVVETVDRIELADRLDGLLAPRSRILPVFLEVNVGGEPQKSGATLEGSVALARHLVTHCPHLRLEGLMTVPPYDPDPEHARPHFRALRDLGRRIAGEIGVSTLQLSMGMSDDFEVAVEEGAAWVRLGRVLFGERRPKV